MMDSKPILAQVHDLQVLVNKIKVVNIDIRETFQAGAIIAKLPPSWKDTIRSCYIVMKISHWRNFRNTFESRRR